MAEPAQLAPSSRARARAAGGVALPGRALISRTSVLGPVLVVAMVLGFLIAARLSTYHGNAAGFVLFGQRYVHYTHPPAGAPINSTDGYDGQFYWLQATDPLLLHHSTLTDIHNTAPGYHLQRPAYPALAYALALGMRSALPWTLLAVNVLAVLGITAAFSFYARRRGWSCWWALAIGLVPGLLMPTLRDLSDPLAVAAMVGGGRARSRGRSWLAAGLLAVGVLAREPMMVAVVAVGLDAACAWWRVRRTPGSLRRAVRHAWPAVVIPVAVFLAWQVYIHARYSAAAAAASSPLLPFKDFVDEVRYALAHDSPAGALWDLVYLLLILAGMGAAVALVVRRISAPTIAAALFALSLTVIVFGDQWGDTRYSAPLFATLLLGGLELGSRRATAICAVAAGMTLFLPVAIVGI
jgi:hypothetical protein